MIAQNITNIGVIACLFFMYMNNRLTEKRLHFLEKAIYDIIKEKAGRKHDVYSETYTKDVR